MVGGLKFGSFSHDITAAVISDNEMAAMCVWLENSVGVDVKITLFFREIYIA